jgi:class 3 adenylate cyclase/predicted ATPase
VNVSEWLDTLGLGEYARSFTDNRIDAEVLRQLTAEDLKELGVTALGDRKKLLAAISELRPKEAEAEMRPLPSRRAAPARRASEAERRQLTVMFCDLVGSTALSARLDPEEMREVVHAYQNTVAGEIARFEGHVAKFMGDGVLAYFGYPKAHEDDAERSVRAGLAVTAAVSRLKAPSGEALAARLGIATGLVVVGDLAGEGAAQEEAVVGETPNLAARLQAIAEPGTVVISPGTRRLLGDLFELGDLGGQRLKGIADPVQAWRVGRERPAKSRFEATHGAGLTPFVGREHELTLLLDRWEQATGGEGQVVVLSGEPGIGKSRITQALRERIAGEPHTRLRYQCSPHHTNSALHPIIAQLELAAGFGLGDTPERKLEKLEALLAQTSVDIHAVAPLFAALLSMPTADRYPPLDITPQRQKERTLEALADQLIGLAARQPVLLILEDAHWIDPTTTEFLAQVVDRVQDAPVLVVVTFRPEFKPPWVGHGHVTALALNRLGRRHCAAMAENVTAGKVLPAVLRDEIIAKTDGVPLFVEELTKSVIESRLLSDAGDRYELTGPLPALAIPATLTDSLMARLDRLVSAKEVAQIGAVIGREFSYDLLASASDLTDRQLRDALAQLVDSQLAFQRGSPPRASYTFKHALVQDAAYASLLKSRRRQFHARIAKELETRFPDKVVSEPEVLAHHCTQAGLEEEAIRYWGRAGERAAERSANHEAIAHFSKGIGLLHGLPEGKERDRRELELLIALGPQLMMTRGLVSKEVESTYNRARDLSRKIGNISQRFTALWGLWHMNELRAEWKQALSLAEELMGLARQQEDAGLLLQAHHAEWSTRLFQGDLVGAREHADHGCRLYDFTQHRNHALAYGGHDPGVCARQVHAVAQSVLGFPEQALASADEGIRLANRLDHPASQACVHVFAGLANQIHRRAQATKVHADAAVAIAEAHKILPFAQMGRILRGWAKVESGAAREGVRELEAILAPARAKTRKRALLPLYLGLLADAYLRLGQIESGLAALDEAFAKVALQDEHFWEPELHRLKAALLDSGQQPDEALGQACLEKAIEIARGQRAKAFELRAATDLARLWQRQGRIAEARDLLAPIYDWFTEGFDTADLKNAKGLLDKLA